MQYQSHRSIRNTQKHPKYPENQQSLTLSGIHDADGNNTNVYERLNKIAFNSVLASFVYFSIFHSVTVLSLHAHSMFSSIYSRCANFTRTPKCNGHTFRSKSSMFNVICARFFFSWPGSSLRFSGYYDNFRF